VKIKLKLVYIILIVTLYTPNSFSLVKPIKCINVFAGEQRTNGLFIPEFITSDNEVVFIAKIYNQIDFKNKKVFTIFKPIANVKSTINEFKIDVTFMYEKFVSRKNIGCNIVWQLERVGMLITSKRTAFKFKNSKFGSNEIDLNQFVDNSIGFYLEEDGLKIKDITKDIQIWNSYLSDVDLKKEHRNLSKKELAQKLNIRKNLNYIYFKKFQKYLN
jgi:hypothetical protein